MIVIRFLDPTTEARNKVITLLGGPDNVVAEVDLWGFSHLLTNNHETTDQISQVPGVETVIALDTPYILSSRLTAPARTRVEINPGLVMGGEEFLVMGGPCAVESAFQVKAVAGPIAAAGARVLRGGAYKPRTSPFSFQGRGKEGLEILQQAARERGMATISEVMDTKCVDEVVALSDIVQVGMRNCQNYPLLSKLGRHPDQPAVVLKRGAGTTLDEFLAAADYILSGGNPNLILCLRGTVDFSNYSRGSLNIADIPTLRHLSHLPILVDPSHAAGKRELVPAMSAAAMAAGADGLLVEVHHQPEEALSDGCQSLTPDQFQRLMHRLHRLAPVLGRTMAPLAGNIANDQGHPLEDLAMEKPPLNAADDKKANQRGNI